MIHNFCGQTDFNCETGSNPSFVVQDANGNLFGTTVYGGSSIFEITPTHEYRTVYSFTSDEGGNLTGIILASDGNLYGVTTGPGTTLLTGTVFSVTPAGVSTTLHSFYNTGGPTDVVFPVFQGTDGDFYGSTVYGPNISYGVMYRVSNGAGPLVETAPVAGPVGKSVLILGNNLTGTTSVTFNGVEATFTVKSDTYIKATVPTGATTGTVSVVTSSGTLNSNPQFVVTK